MGEAFKRMRARPFLHRQNTAYQRLVHHNLLTLSRSALASSELQGRLTSRNVEAAVGSDCLLRSCEGGGHEVVLGNVVVASSGLKRPLSFESARLILPPSMAPCSVEWSAWALLEASPSRLSCLVRQTNDQARATCSRRAPRLFGLRVPPAVWRPRAAIVLRVLLRLRSLRR